MNKIIEEVAKAINIASADDGDLWEEYIDQAKAAIACIADAGPCPEGLQGVAKIYNLQDPYNASLAIAIINAYLTTLKESV